MIPISIEGDNFSKTRLCNVYRTMHENPKRTRPVLASMNHVDANIDSFESENASH